MSSAEFFFENFDSGFIPIYGRFVNHNVNLHNLICNWITVIIARSSVEVYKQKGDGRDEKESKFGNQFGYLRGYGFGVCGSSVGGGIV